MKTGRVDEFRVDFVTRGGGFRVVDPVTVDDRDL